MILERLSWATVFGAPSVRAGPPGVHVGRGLAHHGRYARGVHGGEPRGLPRTNRKNEVAQFVNHKSPQTGAVSAWMAQRNIAYR